MSESELPEHKRIWIRSRNRPFSVNDQPFSLTKVHDDDIGFVRDDSLAERIADELFEGAERLAVPCTAEGETEVRLWTSKPAVIDRIKSVIENEGK